MQKGEYMLIKHDKIKPIEFDNLKIVDYTAGQGSSSSFAEITVPVGISHKISWSNRSDKYYYIVKGNVAFTINEKTDNLSAGDFCLVSKDERFSYKNIGTKNAILILVHTPSFKLECEGFEE
jgi:mannose-6-phosphate isomerase-like protein (cupin superfamily)